ncbi:MAG: hypothetical protein NW205_01690 [Hyphomicrobiaceae bacterium]|nr:hypothetical protein [Hyphomicrobiaceae bacterium]
MTRRAKMLVQAADARHSRKIAALSAEDEANVARFQGSVRRELRRLMRTWPGVSDLARTFPACAQVLAVGQLPPDQKRLILTAVADGEQLKSIARHMGLPWWMRQLAPEMLQDGVPEVPQSEAFARRVASRLPAAGATPLWLDAVAFGARAVNEDFAIWLAGQDLYKERGEAQRLFALLAAYAWYSGQPGTAAHGLINVPWRSEISFETALCAAKSWFNRLRLIVELERGTIGDTWLKGGTASGYSFVPIVDNATILEEARAMQNCADQYAERLARDRCRLFSVRRGAVRVAMLEVGAHPREPAVLTVTQLKARHNMPAPVEVWQAAHLWLSQQTGLRRIGPIAQPERPLAVKRWTELLQPYRAQRNGAPWLPGDITHRVLHQLDADISDLARRGDVNSWLFT